MEKNSVNTQQNLSLFDDRKKVIRVWSKHDGGVNNDKGVNYPFKKKCSDVGFRLFRE